MSKAVNSKWKKTFPDTIGNQNRPATGVDDTQEFETGAFPQYMANDPVRYDLQNAAMSQLMSNDARLKEMVDARGKELDDHKVDPGAHKTGIAGNAATATKVVTTAATGASANIAEASMGGSDSARIRVSGAENAGELALETANDGDEAIVARQYTGVYTNAVRTAKILDESGNTSFPGTVVAPKFTGTLNGNAATASKLLTPRTISLTGKAAGSTSFDGSANASINVKSVNADTASKLSTARKINITGNATGAAAFDGSGDVSINVSVNSAAKATNDKNGADIAATYLKKAGDTATGKITFNSTDLNALPEVKKTSDNNMSGIRFSSKSKFLGAVGKRLSNGEDLLNLRSDNSSTDIVLDSRNYGNYALPKSGGTMTGALNFANSTWNTVGDDSYMGDHDISGTFCIKGANGETGIALVNANNEGDYARISYGGGNINFNKTIGGNINGNAATATRATTAAKADGLTSNLVFPDIGNVGTSNKISWSGSTDGADIYYQTTASDQGNLVLNLRDDDNCYLRIARNGAFKSYFSPSDGNFHGNVNGNTDTATNADKLDGYHASDLFRHLGGNQTPVITDIFDRAGTIDMTTMSAADKATHKANINKARNATQNIWNTDTGIYAYGGDYDMSNGYGCGSLKLTQSYKNFDKILVVGANDKGELLIYKLWDVWALANAFAGGSRFQLFHGSDYWFLYGSARKGTRAGYALSTDTVWSCQDQNSGIVAIYGIKY